MSIYQFLHQYCKHCHSILKRSQLFSFFVKQRVVFELEWGNVLAAVNFEKGASEGEREEKETIKKSQKKNSCLPLQCKFTKFIYFNFIQFNLIQFNEIQFNSIQFNSIFLPAPIHLHLLLIIS